MINEGWIDEEFIRRHTAGFEDLQRTLEQTSWEELETGSGVKRDGMREFAQMVAKSERAVFVWGMGITQHTCGEDNVHAIINLALAKGFVGREGCGLMPIRGHSGVQGGAEMGAYATAFPGGLVINEENAAKFSALWGFPVPGQRGLTVAEMLEAARRGELEVLWSTGGDFREVMPDPQSTESALRAIPLRIHQDIVLSSQMLIEPADTVVLLPATTRYEIPGGVTETSTERRVIFSPEIPGPRIGEARPEWEVFMKVARRVRPEWSEKLTFTGTEAVREEIGRVIPAYAGIQNLNKPGHNFQYGGSMLCAGWRFPTPDGKAHFKSVKPSHATPAPGTFRVVTRRGKQFNSMVHEDTDPSNAAPRNAILMSPEDAKRLGFAPGDAVELKNDFGIYRGNVMPASVANGTLEIYWPEGNVLVDPKTRSPLGAIPAYKEISATLERIKETGQEHSILRV
jgi:molybdopterin-dependent oxidoreductase alpha subunit